MSHLRCITITGADDAVDPLELVALTKAYPFVEWGILRSTSQEGGPRYPTEKWRSNLWIHHTPGMRFAAHLCGRLAREAMAGSNTWSGESSRLDCPLQYQRVQLNGFSNWHLPGLRVASKFPRIEFILQCADGVAVHAAADLRVEHSNIAALWDRSGGRGAQEIVFPVPTRIGLGFAGGINRGSVVDIITSLTERELPFWIDMESGVRTDDRFDLDKVHRVLDLAAPFWSAA